MRGEGQRLKAHLKAVFAEIERLQVEYRDAIEQLETYTLTNLSPESAVEWFNMYLRVVDVGVQIRRGEIRHRTGQKFKYSCMHKTGTKGAVHSGLSIDDGNAIYLLLSSQGLVKESLLETWFFRIDTLDRDEIGTLDKRVSGCLEDFRRRRSMFYDRLEVTGKDPHEKMLVLGEPGASAAVLATATRTCFGPGSCSCTEDARPWKGFYLEPADPNAKNKVSTGITKGVGPVQADDVGIMDIKRRMGFQELSRDQQTEDAAALARDAAELAQRTKPQKHFATGGGIRVPPSARSVYQKKCEVNGVSPKPHILAMISVKNGAHRLDLSGIGFHSVSDLQHLVDIFSTPGLPPVKELNLANGFFNSVSFPVLCQLLRVTQLRQTIERLSLRAIALPQRTEFGALIQLLTGDTGSSLPVLVNLKSLDLSFNTFGPEIAVQLQPLLTSLQRLEHLSLESCFPDSLSSVDLVTATVSPNTANEGIRAALAEISIRLESFNFGSNWVPLESRWFEALFTPGSTLQKLDLRRLSASSINVSVGEVPEVMEVDWQGETWGLQHLETLAWSSSCSVFTEKLIGALSAELQSGFSQLQHIDMELNVMDDGCQVGKSTTELITRLADYSALKSCRLCCYSQSAVLPLSLSVSVGRLMEYGLPDCEMLLLRMPQLYLTPGAIRNLLSSPAIPKMKKMTLALGIIPASHDEQIFGSCFLQMQLMREFTLELHAVIAEQGNAGAGATAISLVRELETSWLTLSPSHDGSLAKAPAGATKKLNRSFVLSEQQKVDTQIYRCRFLATRTP